VAAELWRQFGTRLARPAAADPQAPFAAAIVALGPGWRAVTAALRLAATTGLAALALGMLLRHGLQVGSLSQIGWFASAVVAPALAAWAIQRAFGGRAWLEADRLVLDLRNRRVEIPAAGIARLRVWRLPLPGAGVELRLAPGRYRNQGLMLADPAALLQALRTAGMPTGAVDAAASPWLDWARLRAAVRRYWFDAPWFRFVLFPLLPALPAFRLHQHIAFGGTFGEYYLYGLQAWLTGLLIWWVSWAIGLTLLAALLRILIEAGSLPALALWPQRATEARHALEWLGRIVFYIGVPTWLVLRILGS
jgi:apolipoprotein N-acyltransferase